MTGRAGSAKSIRPTCEHVFVQNPNYKGNVAEELTRLKQQPGKDVSIVGSGTLVRSLLRDDLLDELRLLVHPIVVGRGKRLFAGEGANEGDPKPLKLVDSKTTSPYQGTIDTTQFANGAATVMAIGLTLTTCFPAFAAASTRSTFSLV